jgi:parvulin-like peptidyl-prolyl isomerase
MPQLVKEMLIDEAIADIQLDPDIVISAVEQFYKSNNLIDAAVKQSYQKRTGITDEQLQNIAIRPQRIEGFKRERFYGKVDSLFLQCKAQLNEVVYSLLRVQEAELAQELYFRISDGEQTFAELAKLYSQGPEKGTGGLIGPVAMSKPHPTIVEHLRRLRPGQMLPPLRLEDWYVLIRLEDLIPAKLDQATEQRLLNYLFEEWIDQAVAERLSSGDIMALLS